MPVAGWDGGHSRGAHASIGRMELEEALVEVWRQALVEEKKTVELEGDLFPIERTRRQKLRAVEFRFGGREFSGIEQNPATGSVWAGRTPAGRRCHLPIQF